MRKPLPSSMFVEQSQSRLAVLRDWVLDNEVTELTMTERQFWIFATLQPPAEKPWTTFMGRPVYVPDMPAAAQKCLGLVDRSGQGVI